MRDHQTGPSKLGAALHTVLGLKGFFIAPGPIASKVRRSRPAPFDFLQPEASKTLSSSRTHITTVVSLQLAAGA